MATVRSDFISFNQGINRSGNWYERPVGSLEDCLNLIPEDMTYVNDTGAWPSTATGALRAKTLTVATGISGNSKYFNNTNTIEGVEYEYVIDSDKVFKSTTHAVTPITCTEVGAVEQNMVWVGKKGFLATGGYGATNNSVIYTEALSASWVAQTPKYISRMTFHDGRLYCIRNKENTFLDNPDRLYYSEGDFTFLSASGFTDVEEGAEAYNVFSMNNQLYVYHSKGITRIVGDPVNGFTYDKQFTFTGDKGGDLINGVYDAFIFAIGYKPYIFDGQSITRVLEGHDVDVRKVGNFGSDYVVFSRQQWRANNKESRNIAFWNTRENKVWNLDMSYSTQEGISDPQASDISSGESYMDPESVTKVSEGYVVPDSVRSVNLDGSADTEFPALVSQSQPNTLSLDDFDMTAPGTAEYTSVDGTIYYITLTWNSTHNRYQFTMDETNSGSARYFEFLSDTQGPDGFVGRYSCTVRQWNGADQNLGSSGTLMVRSNKNMYDDDSDVGWASGGGTIFKFNGDYATDDLNSLEMQGAPESLFGVHTSDPRSCYLVTNPIMFKDQILPNELTVVAELSDGAEMHVYATNQPNTINGLEPTWISGTVEQANVANTSRYRVKFPEVKGKSFRFKVAFNATPITSDNPCNNVRLWGIEDIHGTVLQDRIGQ